MDLAVCNLYHHKPKYRISPKPNNQSKLPAYLPVPINPFQHTLHGPSWLIC